MRRHNPKSRRQSSGYKDKSHRELVRHALRGELPGTPVSFRPRPNPTGVVKTCERVAGGRAQVKPKTYVYRPTRCVHRSKAGSYTGMTATQWDADTEKMDRAVIIMAETVYKNKPARDAMFAHEYTELIKDSQGTSEKEGHAYAVKSENIIARKHGTTRTELLRQERADYFEAYGCKTKPKKKQDNRSPLMTQAFY